MTEVASTEKDFAAAWKAGHATTPEQTITSQGNAIIAPLAAPAPLHRPRTRLHQRILPG